jgi:hypothetical protein
MVQNSPHDAAVPDSNISTGPGGAWRGFLAGAAGIPGERRSEDEVEAASTEHEGATRSDCEGLQHVEGTDAEQRGEIGTENLTRTPLLPPCLTSSVPACMSPLCLRPVAGQTPNGTSIDPRARSGWRERKAHCGADQTTLSNSSVSVVASLPTHSQTFPNSATRLLRTSKGDVVVSPEIDRGCCGPTKEVTLSLSTLVHIE